MIHNVTSSLSTFKPIKLRSGLNLIVAEKSENATDLQTRNGSGKSSFVRIIDFLLGSKCDADSIFRGKSLKDEQFSISLELGGSRTSVTRSGSTKRYLVVDGNFEAWSIQPKLEKISGEYRISETKWRMVLGKLMFDLDDDLPASSPTFRSMISYFVRRESSGGFQDAERQSRKQLPSDVQINLSYLLGLNWRISQSLNEVRQREKSLQALRKEAKGGALGNLLGDVGELRTRLAVAQREVKKLQGELANYQVLPEYHDLEKEASTLANQLSRLISQNTLDRQKTDSIQSQLESERSADVEDVVGVYEEVSIVLPNLVRKRIEDVRRFHEAIVQNRRMHLQRQLDDIQAEITRRNAKADTIERRRQEIMVTLVTHGALDQYSKLQAELSRKQAQLEELKRKSEMAKQLDSQGTELTIERAQIRRQLGADLDDRDDELNEAILIFEDFSRRISDHEGSLVVSPTDNGPEFRITVEGKESRGIRNMQVFCFDLMLAVLWARRGIGPGFLVHDSHLFDGMDPRQVAKAIEIGSEQAIKNGFQYIVCINSDQLESAEFSKSFDPNQCRNPVEITDATNDGGIFGIRLEM